ncbi:hypothetical protein [Nonomuraea dietziae]
MATIIPAVPVTIQTSSRKPGSTNSRPVWRAGSCCWPALAMRIRCAPALS